MTKEKLQIITCDRKAGMIILDALELEQKCSFCGEKITEKNFGGVFSLPSRVCCDNILCLSSVISYGE